VWNDDEYPPPTIWDDEDPFLFDFWELVGIFMRISFGVPQISREA
jgi:hypothetical protein